MAENFQGQVEALFRGMEDFITTKTVVGEAVHIGSTTILPLVDVTFGCAASAKNEPQRHNGGGGMGGKITPAAVLVIKDGTTRLVNVKSQDGLSKLIDRVPELVNRLKSSKDEEPEVKDAVREAGKKEETF